MSIGVILLVVVAILALFGVLQRVLDRMRLTDRQALLLVAAIFVGGLLPDIPVTEYFSFNIGGALIPVALCVYLFVKAGTAKERVRSIVASVLAAGAVYGLSLIMPTEPEAEWIDVSYIYGPVAGIIAYLFGRSRRCAFIAGVMGILLADTATALVMSARGTPIPLRLGGGGAFDAVVISGLLAVILAEGVGELLERAQGGSIHTDKEFENGEFVTIDRSKEKEGVEIINGKMKLYSYCILVSEIENGVAKVFNLQSSTTLRHVKEFLLQNGFNAESKKQIEKDYYVA